MGISGFKKPQIFKEKGFRNYRSKIRIDNVIFNSIVRVGRAKFGDLFYDINLEVDQILPHTESASEIKRSTSDNRVPQDESAVKNNFMQEDENYSGNKGGEIKYRKTTDIYDYSKSFSEQIDDYKKGEFPERDTFIVRGTPKKYQKIGLLSLPMTYTQAHLKEALINSDGDHLGEEFIKKLPESLENPIAIIGSDSVHGRIVAIIEIPGNTRNVIAAVEIEGIGKMHGNEIDSNHIVSVHSRNNAISKLLKDAIKLEKNGQIGIYYWEKNKANSMLRSGVQFPGAATIPNGFIHSIREKGSPVNMRLKNVTESSRFKRWFGDWQSNPKKEMLIVYTIIPPERLKQGMHPTVLN